MTLKRTSLYGNHVSLQARLVPFAGWEMPIQYSSILKEAKAVRSQAGIFDVSHMGRVKVNGPDAARFLDTMVTADIRGMPAGRARYTFICNERGGIIDDTIVYRLAEERFLVIPNASNTSDVLAWFDRWVGSYGNGVTFEVITDTTSLIALQGPLAVAILQGVCQFDVLMIKPFNCKEETVYGVSSLICRTGYTGEDGFEIIIPAEHAGMLWSKFVADGAIPCGLGARDVLRLEAGLLLHGSDMDITKTPLEAGLNRFVNWNKDYFIGCEPLRELKETGFDTVLAGFHLLDKGIPRHEYPIWAKGEAIGEVTSGTYSPTLDMGIGLGYVSREFADVGTKIAIEIRGNMIDAQIVNIPFYRREK